LKKIENYFTNEGKETTEIDGSGIENEENKE